MAKYFLLSFDDGTIYDRRFVELLNQYHFKGTFNLNSGLEDFIWYYEENFPICRQTLSEIGGFYLGHEIASHSLHHCWLNTLTPPQLSREISEDCKTLKKLFGLEEIGFGVPFTACGEREIKIIRKFACRSFRKPLPFRRILIIFPFMACIMMPISGRKLPGSLNLVWKMLCLSWQATPMNWRF